MSHEWDRPAIMDVIKSAADALDGIGLHPACDDRMWHVRSALDMIEMIRADERRLAALTNWANPWMPEYELS